MFALTLQGCTCQSAAPDTCKTPTPAGPTPMPYVNIFMCNMIKSNTATSKVTFAGAKVATIKSETSLSNGDEPGVNGGVVSNKFIGPGKFLKGSAKVKVENKPPVIQGAMSGHNNNNTTGQCPMAAQTKVQIGG